MVVSFFMPIYNADDSLVDSFVAVVIRDYQLRGLIIGSEHVFYGG